MFRSKRKSLLVGGWKDMEHYHSVWKGRIYSNTNAQILVRIGVFSEEDYTFIAVLQQ